MPQWLCSVAGNGTANIELPGAAKLHNNAHRYEVESDCCQHRGATQYAQRRERRRVSWRAANHNIDGREPEGMSLQRFDVRDYPIDSADLAVAELSVGDREDVQMVWWLFRGYFPHVDLQPAGTRAELTLMIVLITQHLRARERARPKANWGPHHHRVRVQDAFARIMGIYDANDASFAYAQRAVVLEEQLEQEIEEEPGSHSASSKKKKKHMEQRLAELGFRTLRHVVFASYMRPLQHRFSRSWQATSTPKTKDAIIQSPYFQPCRNSPQPLPPRGRAVSLPCIAINAETNGPGGKLSQARTEAAVCMQPPLSQQWPDIVMVAPPTKPQCQDIGEMRQRMVSTLPANDAAPDGKRCCFVWRPHLWFCRVSFSVSAIWQASSLRDNKDHDD